ELEDTVHELKAERTAVPAISTSQPLNLPGGVETDSAGTSPGRANPVTGSATGALSETSQSGPLAGWDDRYGFFLRSADNNFFLRITGQIQADYRAFLDGRDYTDIDTFLVRRARLGIEADMFKYYEFRLLPDFSNAQGPGVFAQTRIQDAYINV